MKISCFALALLITIRAATCAQTDPPGSSGEQVTIPTNETAYAVVERGANHRVWQMTNYATLSSGETVPHIHKYTELATGMHYQGAQGEWLESKEEILPSPTGGAEAVRGSHKAYFPLDIYNGTIEMITMEGNHLKNRPLGLAYCDGTNSVMIAELTNSVGQISGNQVIYANCFTDFQVDLVATYRKSGFESEVIFRQQPPSPEEYGLDSKTTRLQLWTEFFDTVEPAQVVIAADQEDALQDRTLQFGSSLRMVHGKAFSVGASAQRTNPIEEDQMPVYKSWVHLEGRTFLIEELPLKNMVGELQKLASLGSPSIQETRLASLRRSAPRQFLPPRRTAKVKTGTMQQAKADLIDRAGVVLDYVTVSAMPTDFVFQGNQTYLVNGTVNLLGITTIEGGAIVKYDTQNTSVIQTWGNVVCKTSAYRPAIFTSRNDDTVGEAMSVTNTPMIYGNMLSPNAAGADVVMHDIRVSYATYGIHPWRENFTLNNAQFLHCQYPLYPEYLACTLNNILITDVGVAAISGANYTVSGNHITIDGCGQVAVSWSTPSLSTVALTNCLLVNVISNGTVAVTTDHTERPATNPPLFQVAGAGSHYLAVNSPYRDAGTTNINAAMLASLKTKTTYPPIILTNTITSNTTLSPQAQRDTDIPDLGYHYDALDYFVSCIVSNAAVTLTNGVALAYNYSDWTGGGGFMLQNGSNFVSQGTALQRNYIVHHSLVQEGPAPLWTAAYSYHNAQVYSWPINTYHSNTTLAPAMTLRDTTIVIPSGSAWLILCNGSHWALSSLTLRDCEIYCGNVMAQFYMNSSYDFENNLIVYPSVDVENAGQLAVHNNLFIGDASSYAYFANWGSSVWTNQDNAYDGCDATVDDTSHGTNGYNAYLNGAIVEDSLYPGDIVTNMSWVAGPLGNYYQPTNSPLINKGSRTADLAGLYHYSVTTNLVSGLQIKETNSVVDIGYHFVAVDANGNPIDTDGDGIPDYLEDANGNGLWDNGESSWLLNNYNGLSFGNGLQVFTPLK